MKEDIEIIKKYIDENIEPFIFENLNYGELYAFREAIENLIKAYKELEENSISKDKIKDKKEELEREYKKNFESYYGANKTEKEIIDRALNNLLPQIFLLKHLLKEE